MQWVSKPAYYNLKHQILYQCWNRLWKQNVFKGILSNCYDPLKMNFHSPCSCQMCGTSARCRHWPLDPGLWGRRTVWTHAAWADQMDTQSWTSYTTDAFQRPAGRPRCCSLNSPSLNWELIVLASKTGATLSEIPTGLLCRRVFRFSQTHDTGI